MSVTRLPPIRTLGDVPGYQGSIWANSNAHKEVGARFVTRIEEALAKKEILKANYRRFKKAEKDYEDFKTQHGLTTNPIYEQSSSYAAGVLAISAAGETAFNAQLFIPASSDTPMAIMLAILVSALNVLLGFSTGKLSFCNLGSSSAAIRRIAILGGALCISFALFFNGVLAVLRQIMEQQHSDNVNVAVAVFIETITPGLGTSHPPMHLRVESVLLSLLGIAIFGVACYKGFTMEGKYPDFAERHRAMSNAEDDWADVRQEMEEDCALEITHLGDVRPAPSAADVIVLRDWCDLTRQKAFTDAETMAS